MIALLLRLLAAIRRRLPGRRRTIVRETHRCRERDNVPASDRAFPGPDTWIVHPGGERTCSFCGSLHEDDFLAIAEAYASGEPGYRFEPTTKAYKFYANRPDVRNAGDGGIKFYAWHVDTTPGADLDRRDAIFRRAMERYRADMRAMTKGK